MCGRLNVNDDPFVHALIESLGADPVCQLRTGSFLSAGDRVSIVIQRQGLRCLQDAVWWLLLQATSEAPGFKPNSRYFSINTNWKSLNDISKAGYKPYRQSRCILPVSGFGESQDGVFHDLRGKDSALLLGGLYKTWMNGDTGELIYSCSVITLAGHPAMQNIHRKACPLMLPSDKVLIDKWLDPDFNQVDYFSSLMTPRIPTDLVVQRIDRPSTALPLGESFVLPEDSMDGFRLT